MSRMARAVPGRNVLGPVARNHETAHQQDHKGQAPGDTRHCTGCLVRRGRGCPLCETTQPPKPRAIQQCRPNQSHDDVERLPVPRASRCVG